MLLTHTCGAVPSQALGTGTTEEGVSCRLAQNARKTRGIITLIGGCVTQHTCKHTHFHDVIVLCWLYQTNTQKRDVIAVCKHTLVMFHHGRGHLKIVHFVSLFLSFLRKAIDNCYY
jgi:hypothetical protein